MSYNYTVIISVVGAIISLIVGPLITFITARMTAKNERKKMQDALRNSHAQKLEEVRIEPYAKLYENLSAFIKRADGYDDPLAQVVITYEDIAKINKSINDWDSKNAILLSDKAATAMHGLRTYLRDALRAREEGEDKFLLRPGDASLARIIDWLVLMEDTLKYDLGIYDIEFHEIRERKRSISDLRTDRGYRKRIRQ